MGHLKECEAKDRLSTGRNTSRNSFRPAGDADYSNSSRIELERSGVRKSSFAEDFMLEHSNSSLFIAMLGRAGRNGSVGKEPHKSTQYYGFPS
jgi:type II secretory pathway component PulJ